MKRSGIQRELAIGFVFWTLIAALEFVQISALLLGRQMPMRLKMVGFTFGWYVWWLATPLIVRLTRRLGFERDERRRALAVHATLALSIATLPSLVNFFATFVVMGPSPSGWEWDLRQMFLFRYPLDVAVYAAVCGVATSLLLLKRSTDEQLAASRLEAELAQSKLQAMTGQLHPHFLFNALNSVAMLIRDGEPRDALKMVLAYGAVLREVLDNKATLVTIEHETDFIVRYIDIEQLRFPDWLTMDVHIAQSAVGALIPPLILQPLVENSLKHGFANIDHGGQVTIVANRIADSLRVEVRDNGAGLPAGWKIEAASGVGLRTTATRLRHQFGEAQQMHVLSSEAGGTTVRLDFPFRLADGVEHYAP